MTHFATFAPSEPAPLPSSPPLKGAPVRVLLLCSAFNGLSQRTWIELRRAGHDVSVELAIDEETMVEAVELARPELIICPFLKDRVPERIWKNHRTVIVHPGPPGDRGPSSLDWAITEGAPEWGVTALQAVEEMDAGPIWGWRTFPLPEQPPKKSSVYNGPVTEAAVALVHEVVAKAADPYFLPEPLDYERPEVTGRLRPTMRQDDRAFRWSDPTSRILRKVRAADGAPGVRTTLCGAEVRVFDAEEGPRVSAEPGTVAARSDGRVLVATGDGGLWVGHLKVGAPGEPGAIKLPAATALGSLIEGVPNADPSVLPADLGYGDGEIVYRRSGTVGVLTFDFYNGAMSTEQCVRLTAGLRHAVRQDTRVLLLRGGEVFSNGIHLNAIEAAEDPEGEAWRNIQAIDDVCREIITCSSQLTVASVGGGAGAGGVMLALGADRVLVRQGAVLNPHYATMGLFGSEYWTYVLPRRVGDAAAAALTGECLPIGAEQAVELGMADEALGGSRPEYEEAALAYARRLADRGNFERVLQAKNDLRQADERRRPLETYRVAELAEMSRDIFDDRNGFREARRSFVHKHKADATPANLADHRAPTMRDVMV